MKKSKAYRIAIRAILTALIILQTMIPFLGYIPLGLTNLTIIHITVIVAAIVLGTKDGMFVGLMWGLFTMIRVWTFPTTLFDTTVFTNPIIAVLPRVLVGLVAGWIFSWLYQRGRRLVFSSMVAAVLGTLTNTLLVLFFMGTLYTEFAAAMYQTTTSHLVIVLGTIAVTNDVSEIIAAVILTPVFVKAIQGIRHLRFVEEK